MRPGGRDRGRRGLFAWRGRRGRGRPTTRPWRRAGAHRPACVRRRRQPCAGVGAGQGGVQARMRGCDCGAGDDCMYRGGGGGGKEEEQKASGEMAGDASVRNK